MVWYKTSSVLTLRQNHKIQTTIAKTIQLNNQYKNNFSFQSSKFFIVSFQTLTSKICKHDKIKTQVPTTITHFLCFNGEKNLLMPEINISFVFIIF